MESDGITYALLLPASPRHTSAMPDAREYLSILEAAEKAAAAGDLASAERLLREAARLQEVSLGPRHPDLANTLNNLGIVCENTGKFADAEQYFRRAVSIARTSLPPDHPFVTTSQKNLRDFCEARGKQVELPAPPPEVPKPAREVTAKVEAKAATAAAPAPQGAIAAPAPQPAIAAPALQPAIAAPTLQPAIDPEPEDPEATSKKFFIRLALGALGPIAMLMVVLAVGLPRLGAPELTALSTTPANSPPEVTPPPVPTSELIAPEAETETSTTDSETEDEPATSDLAPAPAPTPAPERPVVVRASLCGDLDDWSCDPADRPVPPGPLFFYTQIKSLSATTIQHRWYREDRLQQAVELHVQATRTGYRTYSRNLMKSENTGSWRVELRSQDGALLHEERFTVR